MTRSPHRVLALALATLVLSGGAFTAFSPAEAANRTTARCAITAEAYQAAQDAAHLAREKLRGTPPTAAQREDFRRAVEALVQAARDTKLAPELKAAKLAELDSLRTRLEAATTAEERLALRGQILAVRTELKTARLTKGERADLAKQIRVLRDSLRSKLTSVERVQVVKDLAAAQAQLRCSVTGGSTPTASPSASPTVSPSASPTASPTP